MTSRNEARREQKGQTNLRISEEVERPKVEQGIYLEVACWPLVPKWSRGSVLAFGTQVV